MFREMRRSRQTLPQEEIREILRRNTAGVLSLSGDDGYPYGVPLSYVLDGDRLLFHSAQTGHKLDAITRSSKASFCVIDQNEIAPEKYTTLFRSVIVFGRVRVLEDEAARRAALELLAARYSPDDPQGRLLEVEKGLARVCMIELSIEHASGKEAIELVRRREEAAN